MSRVLKCDYVIMENRYAIDDDIAAAPIKIENDDINDTAIKMQKTNENADFIINNALERAEEIRLNAQTEAQILLNEAKHIKENAYKSGLEQGLDSGIQQGRKKVVENESEAVAQLQEAARRLEECSSDLDESINNQAVEFAFYLAEKIVDLQIDKNDEAFINICKNAASHIGEASSIKLKVGPREYEIITRFQKEFIKSINGLESLEIELEDVKNGHCIIEASAGSIDASVNAQLNRAKKMINIESENK